MTSTVQNARAVSAEISTLIAGSVSSVRAAYVNEQANKEIASRTDTFTKAMEKLGTLQGELKKIKPDRVDVTFQKVEGPDQPQQVESEVWSKDSLKKKAELVDKLKRLDDAIAAYLSFDATDPANQNLDPNKDPYKILKDTLGKLG